MTLSLLIQLLLDPSPLKGEVLHLSLIYFQTTDFVFSGFSWRFRQLSRIWQTPLFCCDPNIVGRICMQEKYKQKMYWMSFLYYLSDYHICLQQHMLWFAYIFDTYMLTLKNAFRLVCISMFNILITYEVMLPNRVSIVVSIVVALLSIAPLMPSNTGPPSWLKMLMEAASMGVNSGGAPPPVLGCFRLSTFFLAERKMHYRYEVRLFALRCWNCIHGTVYVILL